MISTVARSREFFYDGLFVPFQSVAQVLKKIFSLGKTVPFIHRISINVWGFHHCASLNKDIREQPVNWIC